MLAAERTLLAWIRTGLAVVALGFLLTRHDGGDPLVVGVGVALTVTGSVAPLISAWSYHRLYRALRTQFPSQRHLAIWAVWFAVVVGLIGIVLVIDLLIRPVATPSIRP